MHRCFASLLLCSSVSPQSACNLSLLHPQAHPEDLPSAFSSHPQPSLGTGSVPQSQGSPVWGVLGASLPSAPCRSRTHGSCPCSSREISSGLKTRNPAVEVANKDTKLAWLGMQPRAQRPWLPGVKGWGLRRHRTASEGAPRPLRLLSPAAEAGQRRKL